MRLSFPGLSQYPETREMKREYIFKGLKGKYLLMLDLINPQNSSSHFVSENENLRMNSASSKVIAKIFD